MDELDLERDPVYEGERGCPACRAEIERLRDALQGLLEAFPMADPYGSLWTEYRAATAAARDALGEES